MYHLKQKKMNPVENNAETLATKRTDLMLVDPRNCTVEEGFNVREDYGDIKGLAKSVVELGVVEPIVGYKVRNEDRYIMTDGHRRLTAVMLAFTLHAKGEPGFEDISKIERIPMRTASADPKERLYIMAVTGEKKKSLTDMEKAKMYARLIEYGKAEGKSRGDVINDIKARLGVSKATVYNILKLNELPEEIQARISKGEISGSTVNTIIREVKDEAEQIKVVNEAVLAAQAITDGGKKKATASHVKGLKAKSPMQRLKEVAAKLESNGVNNSRAKLLAELIDALENKRSVNKILDLFV